MLALKVLYTGRIAVDNQIGKAGAAKDFDYIGFPTRKPVNARNQTVRQRASMMQ
jgi:hypothetical protein